MIIRDVTERKQAEAELRQSEERFRLVAEVANILVYETDVNAGKINIVRGSKELVGYEPDEVAFTVDWVLGRVHPDDFPNVSTQFKTAIEKGENYSLEYRFLHKKGDYIVVKDTAKAIRDSSGRTLRFIGGIRDITQRIQNEKQLEQYNKQLEKLVEERTKELTLEHQRFYNMLESLPVMVCLITSDYHIAFANRLFREMFGESGGKPCYEYVSGQCAPCSFCESLKPLETGNPHHWVANFSNGTVVDAYDYPFIDVDGKRMVLEVNIDITDRKKLEKQLQDNQRLAAIGATAGMVGHDIRNPLQAITGDIYLLKDYLINMPEIPTKKCVAESLDGIEKSIIYINKIVADLQDYARPVKPEYVDVDLYDLVVSVVEPIAMPHNLALSMDIDASIKIKSDITLLRRILTNLIINAIQAMPNGGNLRINAYQCEDKVILEVEDTGIGIPDEVKPKLFTPMTTTKAKGHGLGLAVVKRLVEALNGTVSFESQEGKGTKFIIELPTSN